MTNQNRYRLLLIPLLVSLFSLSLPAAANINLPINIFPLGNYDQNLEHWIKPSDPDYNDRLLSADKQEKFRQDFYNHYYATGKGALSPWDAEYVEQKLKQKLADFSEVKPIVINGNSANIDITKDIYGENYQQYPKKWLENILANINFKQFKNSEIFKYNENNRGIIIKDTFARSLPTNEPAYYNPELPGEGYPFDLLQESSIWIGTPVYVIDVTFDAQWSLVLTPHIVAWVPSEDVAKTSDRFIKEWQQAAKEGLITITKPKAGIYTRDYGQYLFKTNIGAIFPKSHADDCSISPADRPYRNTTCILVPIAEDPQRNAKIIAARVRSEDAVIMPLPATTKNFAMVTSALLNRPYGWGNMYFYNDCSAELQSLYVPFGIWLPRQTGEQAEIGQPVDLSSKHMTERIGYLMAHGKKFTTIVYINGHVMLYLGNYPNSHSPLNELMAMTYQNVWGLKPADGRYRAVIGKSVLLPLLVSYPEDQALVSLANRPKFKIIDLDNYFPQNLDKKDEL